MDTITFRLDTLGFVLEIMPKGDVFMGTVYPYDMAGEDPVGSVRAEAKDEDLRGKLFGENLGGLMGLF